MSKAIILVTVFLALAVPFAGEAAPPSGDPAAGQQVYNSLCWTCHGRYGRGDGPAAEALTIPLPDFTNSAHIAGRSDQAILERLMGAGHTPMAIATILKEGPLTDAVAYIRTLSIPGKHVSVQAGKDIYNGSCWSCHGAEGNGNGPAAKNVKPPPRDFTSAKFRIEGREEEVIRAITLGPARAFHGSTYMPDWGARLTPQQIRDVVEYLKTFQGTKP